MRAILEALRDFYTIGEAKQWMKAPHPLLDGVAPVDAVLAGRGDEVAALIDQLRSGAHV